MRFKMGRLMMTPGIEALNAQDSVLALLHRHASGDWGDLDQEDKTANEKALGYGGRLLSSYKIGQTKVWIITEADRSVTTVLLPEEY